MPGSLKSVTTRSNGFLAEQLQAGFGVGRRARVKAFFGELQLEQAAHLGFVFDDEDGWFFALHIRSASDANFRAHECTGAAGKKHRGSARPAAIVLRVESSRDDRPRFSRRWRGPAPRRLSSMVKNGLKICSRNSAGTPGPVSSTRRRRRSGRCEVSGATEMRSTSLAAVGLTPHRLKRILNQIHEDALAKLLVDEDIRQIRRVVALDAHLGIGQLRLDGFERAVENRRYALRPQVEVRRPREIEKARHQSVEPVHFGGNIAGELARERLRVLQLLLQHFRRAFDHAERIADFVRQPGGKLAESGEALGAARVGFGAAQLAIGFLERLARAPGSAATWRRFSTAKRFTRIAARKKKGCGWPESVALRCQFVFLQRGNQKRAVGERSERGPQKRADRAEVDRGGDHGQIVDRVVGAVDPDFAGVIEQQSGETILRHDAVDAAASAAWRSAAFEELEARDHEKDELLMDFVDGGRKARPRSSSRIKRRSSRSAIVCGRAFRDCVLLRSPMR